MRTGDVVYHGTIERLREQAPQQAHRINTSDNAAALALGQSHPNLQIAARDGALHARADQAVVDGFVARLITAGISVRGLALEEAPLEALFFMLTEASPESVPSTFEAAGAVA
jgi:ABC-2 type transport system ATP-binding protein